MVKLTQNVEVAYEVEGTYSDPAGSTLSHLGLLDTFDPRSVEMNITPVPSLGQSTDAFHARGPLAVAVPLKVACQGTGWQQLLGRAIGKTDVYGSVDAPHSLTTGVDSIALLAREGSEYTLVTGVVPNEVTLTADYSTGGYITCEANCTGFYTQDSVNDANFSNDDGLLIDDYSSVAFPAAPSADPLLPTDLTVSYAATTDADGLQINRTAGHYVEIGERYMRIYDANGALDTGYAQGDHAALLADGVIDLDHTDTETITELVAVLNAGVTSSATANAGSADPQNLLKGIYRMTGSNVDIPVVADTDTTLTSLTNLKTVALKIANNNTPIPGKVTRGDGTPSVVEWLQNKAISRGKSDITLDLTMTAEDETLYDKYVAGTTIPLFRLDFGTSGSIALTNGTITSFSRPLSPGGEIVDTLSIKFRGSGDIKNFSSFAISADWSL
tara:strand:- start:64 stop:1392 length:1329 start_codon:yes stop_codon:yes gene_type:complete